MHGGKLLVLCYPGRDCPTDMLPSPQGTSSGMLLGLFCVGGAFLKICVRVAVCFVGGGVCRCLLVLLVV